MCMWLQQTQFLQDIYTHAYMRYVSSIPTYFAVWISGPLAYVSIFFRCLAFS